MTSPMHADLDADLVGLLAASSNGRACLQGCQALPLLGQGLAQVKQQQVSSKVAAQPVLLHACQ